MKHNMPMVRSENKANWKWRPKRWWIGLIVFWFISTVGEGIIARSGVAPRGEGGFIIMIMLIFAIWGACTDRGWSVSIRIFWVFGVWIIHSFLSLLTLPITFILGPRPPLVDRATSLFAAFPLVIWAMRRSKFFVEPLKKEIKSQKMFVPSTHWITKQINMLWEKCPFKPENDESLIVDPRTFYCIPAYKEKVKFLLRRYNLPYEEVEVFMHSEAKGPPGRVELRRIYDTDNLSLRDGQTIASIDSNGNYTILDVKNFDNPKIIKVSQPLPIKKIELSMFLNQELIWSRESMGGIIAHEVSHLYLYFKGLQNFVRSDEIKERENECLTDITAFIIGLGELMLNSCKVARTTQKDSELVRETITLGYLSQEQMRFVQDKILSLSKYGSR